MLLTYASGDSAIPTIELLGGKAFNLAALDREARTSRAFKIPPWFAITTEAFDAFVSPAISTGSPRELIQNIAFPPELRDEIHRRISSTVQAGSRFAVRSSAASEDGSEHSFAGQYTSVLGVTEDGIENAMRSVWASLFSEHALDYAAKAGKHSKETIAVIVQELIEPRVSGVAFTIDPVTGEPSSIISSVFGLGEGLVSGLLDADTYRITGKNVSSQLAEKRSAIRSAPDGGTFIEELDDALSRSPTLSEKEAQAIAGMAKRVEALYAAPQDIEWALDVRGTLFLLQARPITAIAKPREESETILWDNSNIVESFSGTTTPLTFSFVSEVYREVYKQFVRVLGVSSKTIAEHEEIFSMVGSIRGRIYYNLANWYRVVSLLPFYEANARFMEQMMGVSEGINVEPVQLAKRGKIRLMASAAATVSTLVFRLFLLSSNTRSFHARLNRVLDVHQSIQGNSSAAECLVHYSHLEEELLKHWTTPIVNDFFVMVFFGVLRKLIASWELSETSQPDALANELISNEGGMISAVPGTEIERIAAAIKASNANEWFELPDESVLLSVQNAAPDIARDIDLYIQRFGERWQHELKLETVTPSEDPSLIVGLLRSHLESSDTAHSKRQLDKSARLQAEKTSFRALKRKPLKRAVFSFVLGQARTRIKARENLRFERTRVFARVRAIYLHIGREFAQQNWVDEPRDIFFLTRAEIANAVDGGSALTELKALIRERKEQLEEYEAIALPARFRTQGEDANGELRIIPEAITPGDGSLCGIGCAPGIMRGEVRIVREPYVSADLRGKIIVAERTDPGWAPIFPLAKGLLVERGSLLSHSAIVARELGLPTIVGIPNLLSLLSNGDEVEFDGTTGIVRKIANAVGRDLPEA